MSHHKPGPWFATENWVFDVGGHPVANFNFASMRREDMRLIAAAPDLLEELKSLVDVILNRDAEDIDHWQLHAKYALQRARDAITKATGGTE